MKLDPEEIYLAQGTLRPDLIESASSLASSNAHVIKTHHNDTQLVRQLRQQVIICCDNSGIGMLYTLLTLAIVQNFVATEFCKYKVLENC